MNTVLILDRCRSVAQVSLLYVIVLPSIPPPNT